MLKKRFLNILLYNNSYRYSFCISQSLKPFKVLSWSRCLATAASDIESTSLTPSSNEKRIIDSYFHQYLLNKPERYKFVFNLNCFNSVNDNDPESIKLLKSYISNTDKTLLDDLESKFKSDVKALSVDDICQTIYLLSQLSELDDTTLHSTLVKVLETNLTEREFSREDYLRLLYVIHKTWTGNKDYVLFLKKKSSLKLATRLHRLTTEQVVQFFYCLTQNYEKVKFKYKILEYLNNNLSQFYGDELGILGFGLMNSKITNNHADIGGVLMKRTLMEIENIHPYSFFILCKIIRKFVFHQNIEQLLEFQEQLIQHTNKFQSVIHMNLALIGVYYRVINWSFWNNLRNVFVKEIQEYEVRDISRFLHILRNYNIQDEEILNLIVKNLETKEISETDHKALFSSLCSLTYFELYPKKLLDIVLTDDFAAKLSNRKVSISDRLNFFYLYWCVKLEKPEFIYNIFENVSKKKFYKPIKYLIINSSNQRYRSYVCTVTNNLIKTFGNDKVYKTSCIPYMEEGCVMRFDKKLEPQPIPEDFKLVEKDCLRKAVKDDHIWVFIMFCTITDYIWNTETLSLDCQKKIKHLKLLGYTPIVVKKYNSQEMDNRSEDDLKELIMESLRDIKLGKNN